MKTTLYSHQVIGASWMLRREFCQDGPRGGILGDEMGMGKTLQALACIVSNRPTSEDLKTWRPLTLIVAPATSLKQWEGEIRKHAEEKYIGGVFQYRDIKKLPPEVVEGFNGIILASYHEVSRQFPSKKLRTQVQNFCGNAKAWKKKWDSNLGVLFKVPFWRVILDEAHSIKNRESQMSISCQSLIGRNRWGMSGTPITNSLDELYPYLKFLKTNWVGDLRDFHYLYANSGDDQSAGRLDAIMSILMLRRTMADTFMGRPLYEIPMCHISVRRVRLTTEERCIRLQDLPIYLVFLLRLRQGAAHPFLLEPVLKKTLKPGDLFDIKSRLRELIIAQKSKETNVCRICYEEPLDGCVAQCEHLFCKDCLDDHIRSERREGRVIPRCPECDKSLTEYESFEESDSEYSDIEDSISRDSFKQHPKLKRSQSKFLLQCDQAYPQPVVPSSKTVAVKQAILRWQSEAPDDKIIVFMEFKLTGAILGRMLEAEGIHFLYFFGDMTTVAKQNAIRGFHERKDIKVMVASFRCGSVALNLTCANRVILVDLWWNYAIEMQAFSRVFRIGQTKETHFLRIIAQNTIDNRLEAVQERKLKNINRALKPGEKEQLSAEDIASLFGHLTKHEDGTFEILPDCEDDAEVDETEEAKVVDD
ncbi:SNF2 family N-terminal domain-containing protein [Nemania diffusa]|nr:SNF2 family N-terminal domain-containing protein [Nemania diffusa]